MMSEELSEYEKERAANIARNQAHLESLGLEPPPTRQQPPKHRVPREPPVHMEPMRASKRMRYALPDYSGTTIDTFGDNESRLKREIRAEELSPPQVAKRRPTAATSQPKIPSAAVEGVRAFIEERVPNDWALEEKVMFGMQMWMLRGNMFIGVGLKSTRLLVRIGEENVEGTLAHHQEGVERCGAQSGRIVD